MLSECENKKLVDAMLNYKPYQGTGVRNQEIQKSGKVRNVTNMKSQNAVMSQNSEKSWNSEKSRIVRKVRMMKKSK